MGERPLGNSTPTLHNELVEMLSREQWFCIFKINV